MLCTYCRANERGIYCYDVEIPFYEKDMPFPYKLRWLVKTVKESGDKIFLLLCRLALRVVLLLPLLLGEVGPQDGAGGEVLSLVHHDVGT